MNQTQKNLLAVGVALAVGAGVIVYLTTKSKTMIDEPFAARFRAGLTAQGLDKVKSVFDADGRLTVYALTPPVEGGSTYVIETAVYPGVVNSWARTHGESRTPIDAPHPDEVATSSYTESNGQTARTHKNCPEKVWTKLFEYFDGIKDAAKKAMEGQ